MSIAILSTTFVIYLKVFFHLSFMINVYYRNKYLDIEDKGWVVQKPRLLQNPNEVFDI